MRGSKKDKGRWIMGIHAVREALKVRPGAVNRIQVRTDYVSNPELKALIQGAPRSVQVEKVPIKILDERGQSQGIAAHITESPSFDWTKLDSDGPHCILILDGIQDPHNLGAILRSSWLLGVKLLVVSESRSSPLTATACKVASGGAEHVAVQIESSLTNVINILKEKGFWIFGLDQGGRGTIWNQEFPLKVALVIGSEEKGIRVPVRRACDEIISIPQADPEASFNASVAAGIALAEVKRQHSNI